MRMRWRIGRKWRFRTAHGRSGPEHPARNDPPPSPQLGTWPDRAWRRPHRHAAHDPVHARERTNTHRGSAGSPNGRCPDRRAPRREWPGPRAARGAACPRANRPASACSHPPCPARSRCDRARHRPAAGRRAASSKQRTDAPYRHRARRRKAPGRARIAARRSRRAPDARVPPATAPAGSPRAAPHARTGQCGIATPPGRPEGRSNRCPRPTPAGPRAEAEE